MPYDPKKRGITEYDQRIQGALQVIASYIQAPISNLRPSESKFNQALSYVMELSKSEDPHGQGWSDDTVKSFARRLYKMSFEKIKANIPIHLSGQDSSKDVIQHLEKLTLEGYPQLLPTLVNGDVSNLKQVGDSIKVSNLKTGIDYYDDTKIITPSDTVVARIDETETEEEPPKQEEEKVGETFEEETQGGEKTPTGEQDHEDLTTSGTVDQALMAQQLSALSEAQALNEEIETRIKFETDGQKKLILKLVQKRIALNLLKQKRAELDQHQQELAMVVVSSTKPGTDPEFLNTELAKEILTPLGLDSTANIQTLSLLSSLDIIESTEDAAIIAASLDPESEIYTLDQQIQSHLPQVLPTDPRVINAIDDIDTFRKTSFLEPESATLVQYQDLQIISFAKATKKATEEVAKFQNSILLNEADKAYPEQSALQEHIEKTNTGNQQAIVRLIESGEANRVIDDINKDVASLQKETREITIKQNPTEVHSIPTAKATEAEAFFRTIREPHLAGSIGFSNLGITPRHVAKASTSLKKQHGKNRQFHLYRTVLKQSQIRQNEGRVPSLDHDISRPKKPSSYQVATSKVASSLPQPIRSTFRFVSHPTQSVGNWVMKQVGQAEGRGFIKGFVQGISLSKQVSVKLLGQATKTITKEGIKQGLKTVAAQLVAKGATTAATTTAAAAAGGTLGALAGPIGIIVGAVLGFVVEKTIGFLWKSFKSVWRNIFGWDFDWKMLAGGAGAVLVAVTSFPLVIMSSISIVFLAPIIFAAIIAGYLFVYIPTINIAPLLSTLVQLESGVGPGGTGIYPGGGGIAPPTISCLKFDNTWGPVPEHQKAIADAATIIASRYPILMNNACKTGTINLRYDPVNVDFCGIATGNAIWFNNFNDCFSGLDPWKVGYTLAHELGHFADRSTPLRQDFLFIIGSEGLLNTYPWDENPTAVPIAEDLAESFGVFVACDNYGSYCNVSASYPNHMRFARKYTIGN